MKKTFLLILALLLSLTVLACAEEAEEKEAEILDLWDYNGESAAWIASVVPVTDGVAVTAAALVPADTEDLAVSDGKTVWEVKAVLPDSTGLLATILYETGGQGSRWGAWPVLEFGKTVQASSCTVRSGDELGSRINVRVLSSESITWKENRCLLVSLSGAAAPGSPVLTADGRLAGVIVSEYAEGENRYLALPAEEIVRCMTEVVDLLTELPGWGNAPEGFRVSNVRNSFTFDWSEMAMPEKAEDETLYLVVVDSGNEYLNFYPAETETKTLTIQLTPGRAYVAGITASKDRPSDYPERYVTVLVPRAEELTDYGFKSKVCAIAEGPEGGATTENPPVPVEEVTEELLSSGRAYFLSTTSYQVTETVSDLPLLVTLTDPRGANYRYESSWIYGPEYMDEDTWFLSLTDIGFLSSYERNGYPKGVWRMDFYVDGKHADSLTFELK